jgi:hypothetical protein
MALESGEKKFEREKRKGRFNGITFVLFSNSTTHCSAANFPV